MRVIFTGFKMVCSTEELKASVQRKEAKIFKEDFEQPTINSFETKVTVLTVSQCSEGMFNSKFSISCVPRREKRHILMWTFFQRSGTFSAILPSLVWFQASFYHFRSVNWAEDWARFAPLKVRSGSVKTREIKIHVYDKRQTWICTTWPSVSLNCRQVFITSTKK